MLTKVQLIVDVLRMGGKSKPQHDVTAENQPTAT
jgi:hypothetical protein